MEHGNKAYGLIQISNAGVKVPKFNVLGYEFFIEFMKAVDAIELAQLVSVKSAWMEENFRSIRKCIIENPIPGHIVDKIFEATAGLSFPIAVRS
jgi:phosphoenolpyruvate synthase/pyruvate phosphate dikinase